MHLFALYLLALNALAQTYFSVPAVDAPELAAFGPHRVGVKTLDLINPGQVDILKYNADRKSAPTADRHLKVQRRWALGLQMQCYDAGQTAK